MTKNTLKKMQKYIDITSKKMYNTITEKIKNDVAEGGGYTVQEGKGKQC